MNANGSILYQGKSVLDGAPIVAIVTGLKRNSRNVKTGDELQVWIIRGDLHPVDAQHNGADASICGGCVHRGKIVDGKNVDRTCYVKVWQAPSSVYRTFAKGGYANAAPDCLAGRVVRIGAYGDPAAVPVDVWAGFLGQATAVTGYTHQWRDVAALKAWCMASVDSPTEYIEARRAGWRTFRVRSDSNAEVYKREVICPASKEAGKRTVCALCKACGGNSSKAKADIVIAMH